MNIALYEIASFMVMRESVVWRWGHTRHHSDTIIVGRDPEIAVPRPPSLPRIIGSFFNFTGYPKCFRHIVVHASGKMTAEEKTIIPEMEFPKVFHRARIYLAINAAVIAEGWISVCASGRLACSDVVRFDHGKKTYALFRDTASHLFATDGICTHGNVHLSQRLVKGDIIECSKHNGRFHLADGSPARAPVRRGLATYPVRESSGLLQINVAKPGGSGARAQKTYRFRVVSNRNVGWTYRRRRSHMTSSRAKA